MTQHKIEDNRLFTTAWLILIKKMFQFDFKWSVSSLSSEDKQLYMLMHSWKEKSQQMLCVSHIPKPRGQWVAEEYLHIIVALD